MISGTRHMHQLPARAERAWALDPEDLEAAIQADLDAGLIPFYLVATFGTTSSCAVDPLRQLGDLAARHGLWCAARAVPDRATFGAQHVPKGRFYLLAVLVLGKKISCSAVQVAHAPIFRLAELLQPPAMFEYLNAGSC